MRVRSPEPDQSGGREHDRVEAAGVELAQPRLDVAADASNGRLGMTRRAARRGARCSCRRARPREDVPASRCSRRQHVASRRGLCGDGRISASRGSSRGSIAPTPGRPASTGRSLALWTARSTAPRASASSISLTNRRLPPASEGARSGETVAGRGDEHHLAGAPRRSSRPPPCWACQRASGLPRVPMRSGRRGRSGGRLAGRSRRLVSSSDEAGAQRQADRGVGHAAWRRGPAAPSAVRWAGQQLLDDSRVISSTLRRASGGSAASFGSSRSSSARRMARAAGAARSTGGTPSRAATTRRTLDLLFDHRFGAAGLAPLRARFSAR